MLKPEIAKLIFFANPVGKIERWMLFYGSNEFKLMGDFIPNDVPKYLKLEGFFESDKGIPLEFRKWEEQIQVNPESITILTYGKGYIDAYLGFDVIPPNIVFSDTPELPKVSVITPVYNSEKFFGSYIQELRSLKYPPDLLEVVIIDDGSSDADSVKIFSREIKDVVPNTLLVRNRENMGIFHSKMVGASVSSGAYITYWDVDDSYDPYMLFLLSVHNALLNRNSENFLVTAPSILVSPSGKVIDVWKTQYGDPIYLVIESMLTFSGRIVITSNLLPREAVVRAYNVLREKYEVLRIAPKLSVPEDTILANQMVLEGFIRKVYPVSYTGRGHVRYSENTSSNLQKRVREVPLLTTLALVGLKNLVGSEKIEELLGKNLKEIVRSVAIYGRFAREFAEKFLEYLELYGEKDLKGEFLKLFKIEGIL